MRKTPRKGIRSVKEPELKGPPKLTLKTLTSGIALAALNAKRIIDIEAASIKKEYEKDELLKHFSVPTFELSEIEVELNFLIEDAGENDIVVTLDAEKLSRFAESASRVKFRLTSRALKEYTLPSGEKVLSG
ncbi:hypothetical protein [Archaeoglobus neptunius]|uniref:hypothetical protein n=1 Tax=Archaeoglobus neptunius TaxID=2798580 RepID=UPI0019261241|nr:hypothetical protein [Archaeoglobus neptunius]